MQIWAPCHFQRSAFAPVSVHTAHKHKYYEWTGRTASLHSGNVIMGIANAAQGRQQQPSWLGRPVCTSLGRMRPLRSTCLHGGNVSAPGAPCKVSLYFPLVLPLFSPSPTHIPSCGKTEQGTPTAKPLPIKIPSPTLSIPQGLGTRNLSPGLYPPWPLSVIEVFPRGMHSRAPSRLSSPNPPKHRNVTTCHIIPGRAYGC